MELRWKLVSGLTLLIMGAIEMVIASILIFQDWRYTYFLPFLPLLPFVGLSGITMLIGSVILLVTGATMLVLHVVHKNKELTPCGAVTMRSEQPSHFASSFRDNLSPLRGD